MFLELMVAALDSIPVAYKAYRAAMEVQSDGNA